MNELFSIAIQQFNVQQYNTTLLDIEVIHLMEMEVLLQHASVPTSAL